jgi:hypothetical protein
MHNSKTADRASANEAVVHRNHDPLLHRAAAGGPPEETDAVLRAALAYHELGLCPIPLVEGSGKPYFKWKRYQTVRPTRTQVSTWFNPSLKRCGIGLVLGSTYGLMVVDVDGETGYRALIAYFREVPRAPTVLKVGHDQVKRQYYFRHPQIPTIWRYSPWTDQLTFRGTGGIVIAPPSVQLGVGQYRWIEGLTLWDLPLPEVPLQIFRELQFRWKTQTWPATYNSRLRRH